MLKIVCKIDPADGLPIIAYRDMSARWGIMTYAHAGQHCEAHPDYHRTLRPARTPQEHDACAALVAEYRGIPGVDGLRVMRRLVK